MKTWKTPKVEVISEESLKNIILITACSLHCSNVCELSDARFLTTDNILGSI